jgi:hypothetical protein
MLNASTIIPLSVFFLGWLCALEAASAGIRSLWRRARKDRI